MTDPAGPEQLVFRASADGFTFHKLAPQPEFVSDLKNSFAGGNTMFWSPAEQHYVLTYRWYDGEWGQVLDERRAEAVGLRPIGKHVYFKDCSDAVLLTSRAGSTTYDRTFMETFIRPGLGDSNWVSRTNYPLTCILPAGPSGCGSSWPMPMSFRSGSGERSGLAAFLPSPVLRLRCDPANAEQRRQWPGATVGRLVHHADAGGRRSVEITYEHDTAAPAIEIDRIVAAEPSHDARELVLAEPLADTRPAAIRDDEHEPGAVVGPAGRRSRVEGASRPLRDLASPQDHAESGHRLPAAVRSRRLAGGDAPAPCGAVP
jgi:hypothetical protein